MTYFLLDGLLVSGGSAGNPQKPFVDVLKPLQDPVTKSLKTPKPSHELYTCPDPRSPGRISFSKSRKSQPKKPKPLKILKKQKLTETVKVQNL